MPAPMIPPITTIVAWKSPNCRASPGRTGLGRGEVWFSVENILGRGSGRDARVLYHSRRVGLHPGGISTAHPTEPLVAWCFAWRQFQTLHNLGLFWPLAVQKQVNAGKHDFREFDPGHVGGAIDGN